MDVLEFKDDFEFLSNFYPSIVKYDGQNYPTVEHAYQAAKTFDKKERKTIQFAVGPGTAKKLGQKVTLRTDWEDVKISIMDDLVWQKFLISEGNSELRSRLLQITGKIVEGNFWGDTFWGVCKGQGRNELGKILMKIRDEIKRTIRMK